MDMNKFKFHTYKSITGTPVVIAVSTYAGKTVKGRAKCDPRDGYDFEAGKKLAAARCAEKVAKKRAKRAKQKFREAAKKLLEAQSYFDKMNCYVIESDLAYIKAKEETASILANM